MKINIKNSILFSIIPLFIVTLSLLFLFQNCGRKKLMGIAIEDKQKQSQQEGGGGTGGEVNVACLATSPSWGGLVLFVTEVYLLTQVPQAAA